MGEVKSTRNITVGWRWNSLLSSFRPWREKKGVRAYRPMLRPFLPSSSPTTSDTEKSKRRKSKRIKNERVISEFMALYYRIGSLSSDSIKLTLKLKPHYFSNYQNNTIVLKEFISLNESSNFVRWKFPKGKKPIEFIIHKIVFLHVLCEYEKASLQCCNVNQHSNDYI